MTQFFETQMGQRFFNAQLPQLISAMKELTIALNAPRPQPVIQLNQEFDKDYLVRLYYDNFDPETAPDKETHRFYNAEIIQIQNQIQALVSEDAWDLVQDSYSAISARTAAEREQAFAVGFRMAVSMIAAGLSSPAHEKDGDNSHGI